MTTVIRTVLRVQDLAEMRSLKGWQLEALVLVPIDGAFIYDPTSTAQDVGGKVTVKPSSVASDQPGRWVDAATIGLSGSPGADGIDGTDGSDGATGPAGPPGAGATFTAENKDVVTIYAGQPVSVHSSGVGVVLADADSAGLPCDGVATVDIAPTFAGVIMTEGTLTLPDWTDATGAPTLPAKSTQYLSATAGLLVAAPDGGVIVQSIGREVKPDTLEVNIKVPILL